MKAVKQESNPTVKVVNTTTPATIVAVKEFVTAELAKLDRGFIATPETLDNLQAFMQANNGSNDFLLMQMAIQYGVKIALENVSELIGK